MCVCVCVYKITRIGPNGNLKDANTNFFAQQMLRHQHDNCCSVEISMEPQNRVPAKRQLYKHYACSGGSKCFHPADPSHKNHSNMVPKHPMHICHDCWASIYNQILYGKRTLNGPAHFTAATPKSLQQDSCNNLCTCFGLIF